MSGAELEDKKHTDEPSQPGGDVSGRWIRDQLRDVASSDTPADKGLSALEQATAEALGDTVSSRSVAAPSDTEIYADLANSISKALLGPIQSLEERRSDSLMKLESRLSEAVERIEGLSEKTGSADRRSEETARRIEGIESGLRHDADELAASIAQLRGTLEELAADVRQLDERVSTQNERLSTQNETVDGLRRLEGRRRDSLQRMAGAASEFQAAINQLSEDSAEGVWTAEPSATNEQ